MGHAVTIPLGVIVARERIEHPWQTYRWRPLRVQLDAPPIAGNWRELSRTAKSVHFHTATLPLQLCRKETMAYRVNLANGEPSVYIVMREETAAGAPPVDVHLVTASPFEAQAHGELGFDRVEAVPMPDRLVLLVRAFIDEHRIEDDLLTRQCERAAANGANAYSEEPIFVVRERPRGEPLSVRSQPRSDSARGTSGDQD